MVITTEELKNLKRVPQSVLDNIGKAVEFISDVVPIKVEQLTDKKIRFQTIGSIANVLNGNNRIIPFSVQRDAVNEWKQGRWQLTSYIEHPNPDEDIRGSLRELAGIAEIQDFNDAGETIVNIRLLDNENGRLVKELFDEGVEIGVSQRALGIQSVREDADGNYFIVVDKIVKILGYDFCLLDSAAAGERTRIRLLDTVEANRIVNLTRIEDNQEEDKVMSIDPQKLQQIVDSNERLIASVASLVDTIQAQMKANSDELPQEILDSFQALRNGVDQLKADTAMDPVKKQERLVQISRELQSIADSVVPPAPPEPVVPASEPEPAVEVATGVLDSINDTVRRMKEYIENAQREKAAREKAAQIGQYLFDKVNGLEQPEDVKNKILDTLKQRSFETKELVDTAVEEMLSMVNLGVAQERMRQEGIIGKGTKTMDVTIVQEHLKGVAALTDMILAAGAIASSKDDIVVGKNRKPVVREFLRIFDTIYGANLAREAQMIQALLDATQTPADFQVPYTISRIVLEEVYSDYLVESLTLFGPMQSKRDSIPITRYRREGGLAATQKTYKPSKARVNALKAGEFGKMASGKLITEWFDIDATASKLQAAFSDEFATLSKRNANITGVSTGIANLIADLKRSIQQMVFANMRDSALAYQSVPFTYNGTGNGTTTEFQVVTNASISTGEPLTVTVAGNMVGEFEVSPTSGAAFFYVVDGPRGKILFVDAFGNPTAPANGAAIVVQGMKATNEIRFSLSGAPSGMPWEKWMNQLLFKVSDTAAAHRQSRGYKPEFILASEVTSNYLTQAEAYGLQNARRGFDAGSVVGEGNYGRTANLPHFGSDVWDDEYILISQKDATIFRIFEPLVLKGPYPTRNDDGSLSGGEEYYVYQEDALRTPLPEKLSLVTVLP
jgi:hypothetical protein